MNEKFSKNYVLNQFFLPLFQVGMKCTMPRLVVKEVFSDFMPEPGHRLFLRGGSCLSLGCRIKFCALILLLFIDHLLTHLPIISIPK